jgi:hypothetical protein
MLCTIMKGMSSQQMIIGLLIIAISYLMYTKYYDVEVEKYSDLTEAEVVEPKETAALATTVSPYSGESASMELSKGSEPINLGKCGNGGQFISSNLLPKDDPKMDDSFSEFAPSLEGKNFVDAYKFVFGSQSQSLRNANYQLRSDPVNPQENICPWMQSTIYPEKRRQLDIGAGQ